MDHSLCRLREKNLLEFAGEVPMDLERCKRCYYVCQAELCMGCGECFKYCIKEKPGCCNYCLKCRNYCSICQTCSECVKNFKNCKKCNKCKECIDDPAVNDTENSLDETGICKLCKNQN